MGHLSLTAKRSIGVTVLPCILDIGRCSASMFETSAHLKNNKGKSGAKFSMSELAKFSRWAVLAAIWLSLLWLGFLSIQYHHSAITGLYVLIAASAVVIFIEQVWNQ